MPVQLPVHFLQVTVERPKFSVFWFGGFFAEIPIGLGKGLFHGKLAPSCIYDDPGINGEFVVFGRSAGPHDEMNTKGVVTFHTHYFFALSVALRMIAKPKK